MESRSAKRKRDESEPVPNLQNRKRERTNESEAAFLTKGGAQSRLDPTMSESQGPSPEQLEAQQRKEEKARRKAESRKRNAAKLKERFFNKLITKLWNKKWKNWPPYPGNPFRAKITRENPPVPNYFDFVKEPPMDLTTIKERKKKFYYTKASMYADDVRLMIRNAQAFNQEWTDVYKFSQWMSRTFEKDYAAIKAELDDEKRKRKASRSG